MNIDDTIVAVSSPPGAGERGIVRLSGPETLSILNTVFRNDDGESVAMDSQPIRTVGVVRFEGETLPASALVFPAGRSYTGQSLAEIHLLGAPILLAMLIEQCLATGARRAEPGEFTARAYFAGRIELTQAHGVAGMIAARSDRQLRAAERLLHGTLERVALDAREALADLLSLVEGAMDFADEPIEFITNNDLIARLDSVRRRLEATLAAGNRAERWNRLPRVVLVGRPNAGKSSLLNRLSGIDRAISTPIAGTTRDALAVPVNLGQSDCLMFDVAGLDDAPIDAIAEIDNLARRAAEEAIRFADLIIVVIDLTDEVNRISRTTPGNSAGTMERAGASQALLNRQIACSSSTPLIVGNKSDIANEEQLQRFQSGGRSSDDRRLTVSAATGQGCDALKSAIAAALAEFDDTSDDPAVALMAEHRDALDAAMSAVARALALAKSSGPRLDEADLVATELRIAASSLGSLVGQDQTEEMLGRIFARFCVGK